MKRKKILVIVAIIILILLVLISILLKLKEDGPIYKMELIIVKANENNILAMELDGSLYNIGTKEYSNLEFKNGQKILIYFNGLILQSYPAQLGNIKKIKIIEEESNVEIPKYILRYCYSSTDNIKVTVNELKNNGITLTITDTNEIPYNYSHKYKIYEKVENENYTGVGQKIGEDTENSLSGYIRT